MTQLDSPSSFRVADTRSEPQRVAEIPNEPVAPPGVARARAYRPELQGLRALAVILVVVYHVWLGRVSGGVDVFFVITGFLIVGQLFRASDRGGIRFGSMWARMIKRLFPAALTVLLSIMVASLVWLPEQRWFQTISEVVAAATYWENWRLAIDSTDYFAQHNEASPVQHFWSLSIQGQFYVVMPLIVALVALLAKLFRLRLKGVLTAVLLAMFGTSLWYSIWLTETTQQVAYFHSLTRVWEFMLGGLLALFITSVSLPRSLRILLGWLGVIGLAICGIVLQVGTMFPGYVALWPTLSAVFVLLAGATDSKIGADRLLSSRPLEFIGNISYAFYLWHWPLLVLYLAVNGISKPGWLEGTAIIGASLLLATITYYAIEEPVRRSRIGVVRPWRAYAFGVTVLVAVLGVAQGWQMYGENLARAAVAESDSTQHPGAQVMTGAVEEQESYDEEPIPSMIALGDDIAELTGQTCEIVPGGPKVEICQSPNAATAKKRIVIVGDSHAQSLVGAFDPLVETNDWHVISMRRPGCPFSVRSELFPNRTSCVEWNKAIIPEITRLQPDAVVVMGTYQVRVGLKERLPDGFIEQWRKLYDAGIPVVAIRDNPRFDYEPTECVEEHGAEAPECIGVRSEHYHSVPPYQGRQDIPPNVRFVDLSDLYCDNYVCPPIIGNIRVYRDENHITQTYMRSMSPMVENRVKRALGW
ncbi:acyltransferase family protein [Haloechinothrix halophila]|uniref:acyltransferase family protein n=1 Tax=Haloechinothrix halophila TaxID=1069073 RepID=UPI00040FF9BE|nr:acyltransferase family protein [Haloechinothrix halophila]